LIFQFLIKYIYAAIFDSLSSADIFVIGAPSLIATTGQAHIASCVEVISSCVSGCFMT
jgi:hypothetical protein